MLLKRANNLCAQDKKRKENVLPGFRTKGTFSFLFLSCTHKLLIRLSNIITRLNDLLCRSNKLFILFKQDNNSLKRLIMSFKQVIYLV